MFSVFIDDSGTDPHQKIAIASGLIIPSKRIIALETEWRTFLAKEHITEFHTSECVARNKKSEFANWDKDRVQRVAARIRQIIRKYFPKGFSISINKAVYDAVVPDDFRRVIGRHHYTWGVDAVCGFIFDWAKQRGVPMEYIFDNIDPKADKAQRTEIEVAMEHGEELHPGCFRGRYSFRKRQDVPGLQCADLFAWTCYQRSVEAMGSRALHPIAKECWDQFASWDNDEWCGAWIATREQLEEWVQRVYGDPAEMARLRRSL